MLLLRRDWLYGFGVDHLDGSHYLMRMEGVFDGERVEWQRGLYVDQLIEEFAGVGLESVY